MEQFLFALALALLSGGVGAEEAQASPTGASSLRHVFATQAPWVIETASKNDEVRSDEYFISRNTEAAHLHAKGRVLEAEGILRSVLKEAIETRGDDDKYTALTMLNLAEICIFQNQYSEAVQLLDAVISIYKKQIGPDHHTTADLIAKLASVHLSQGNIAEAEPLFEEVLRIRRKALGTMHPATLLALDAVGGINFAFGRFEDAQRLYMEALHGFEQTIGPMHEQSERTRRNLIRAQSHLE